MQCGGKGGETVTVSAGEKLDGSVRLFVHFLDIQTVTTFQLRKRISAGDDWCEGPSGRRPPGEEKWRHEPVVTMKKEISYKRNREAFFFDTDGGRYRCLLHSKINNDKN